MPLPKIGYCLLPFVLLPLMHLSVFTSGLSAIKASARLPERRHNLRVRSHRNPSGSTMHQVGHPPV
jgi:hypothetical protein